ncbi:MAG: glycosyltransferase family 4 protein [Acidimicrobiia bacterium]|nr:glycosyltransferase family 4 protein [Acidimicrobiia bacterium]
MHARIVLNALALTPGGSGVQTYIRNLVRALPECVEAELAAVVQSDATGELPSGVAAMERRSCYGVRRSLEGLRSVGAADLVHGLDVDLPLRPGAPTVSTVHDLSFLDVPWAYGRLHRVAKLSTMRRSVRRADALIAVSGFTADRIRHHFRRDAEVVHLAPAPGFAPPAPGDVAAVREAYGLPAEFVLHVGNLEPRKDVPTLAAACREAGVLLVLAGGSIATVDVPAGARLLGYVDVARLPALYAAASAVAYVSRYEGFGLPPLEAMACGAAVVATRVGALPELAEGAVEWVPARDPEAQAVAIRSLVADEEHRSELAAAGLAAVARLSWTETARRTAGVYGSLGIP